MRAFVSLSFFFTVLVINKVMIFPLFTDFSKTTRGLYFLGFRDYYRPVY